MKNSTAYVLPNLVLSVIVFFLMTTLLYAQNKSTVTGTVTDAKSNDALPGASVVLKNTLTGTVTDKDGKYSLEFTLPKDSTVIVVSYVGYESKEVLLSASQTVADIGLSENLIVAKEVVVTASRISEKILEAPVSISTMNAADIKETPKENFYAALSTQKGVDVITNSIFYQSINTRGFNNPGNVRIVQLIDGVDNSLPGVGWAVGNLTGVDDIDIERVELVPGTASALYGANAYNGLVNIFTKNPFTYQGLTVQLKAGVNHIDGKYHDPALFNDVQLRYAQAFKNRFAFKVNFGYIKGIDWILTDSTDLDGSTPESLRGPNNPNRDAVNIYGDEVSTGLPLGPNGKLVNISRTGYDVNEVLALSSYSLKSSAALHYKLSDKMELSYTLAYAKATGTYLQYSFKNFYSLTNKIELSGNNFTLRGYYTNDDAGETFNGFAAAVRINQNWKSDQNWFTDFAASYAGYIPGVTPLDFAAARSYADQGRFLPGSAEYKHVFDSLIQIPITQGGTRYIDRSNRAHVEGQYNFSSLVKLADIVAGASYRRITFNSEATIFIDKPGEPIHYGEYAGYLQAGKKLLKDHLKLVASARYDGSDNFKGRVTPRFAMVIEPDKKNFIRASYQTGFRLPEPLDQYGNVNQGYDYLLGWFNHVDDLYHLKGHSFTSASAVDFNNAVTAYFANGGTSVDEAVALYKNLLKAEPWNYVVPEEIKTFEIGYQRLLYSNSIYFDVDYFHNEHKGLANGGETIVKTASGGPENDDSLTIAAYSLISGEPYSFYELNTVNSFDKVTSDGIEAGLSIVMPKDYVLSGNFTYTNSNVSKDIDVPGIKTPKYKSNLSLSNRNVFKNFGFSINWRWTDAIDRWLNVFKGEAIDNRLPATNVLDMQLNYRMKKAGTTVKIGASNLLNHYYQDLAQGRSVGGLYYVSLTFDGIIK